MVSIHKLHFIPEGPGVEGYQLTNPCQEEDDNE